MLQNMSLHRAHWARIGVSNLNAGLVERLIGYAAFSCYGSAKSTSTLCSRLKRNFPIITHLGS